MTNKLAKTRHQSISHAELEGGAPRTSASSTQAVLPWKQQRQALKILNQVQDDGTYFNNNGFTRPSSLCSVSMRNIGAAVYPGLRPSGMTTGVMGFTLIELLVVVLIIGILAAVALPQYNKAVAKSKAVGLLMATNKLVEAQKLYFLEHDEYASSLNDLNIEIPQYNCKRGDSGGPLIMCNLGNSMGGIVYFHWIDNPWRQCCIYENASWSGKEICQALTGKKNSPPSGASGGYCYLCQGNCPEFL